MEININAAIWRFTRLFRINRTFRYNLFEKMAGVEGRAGKRRFL